MVDYWFEFCYNICNLYYFSFVGVIIIFNRFFKKKEQDNEGFFVYELLEKESKQENTLNNNDVEQMDVSDSNINQPTTVFERVVAKNNSSNKVFKYRYAVIGAITLIVLSALIVLGSYISIYKKNSPATLCEEIIEGYDKNNPNIFIKNCTNLPKVLKNKNNLEVYFKSYLPRNKFTYYQVAADKSDEQKYVFKSGDMKISEIVFKRQKPNAAFGIKKYKVKSFVIVPLTEYRFNAYSGFTLLINSIPANDYLFSKNIALEPFQEYLENPISKDMYIVNDVNYIKELKALDSDGKVYDVVSSVSNFGYDITVKCDDKAKEITEFMSGFVFEYMHYTVKDDRKPKPVLDYLHTNSYICDDIKNYVNNDLTRYDNERIENLKIENLVYYGSGCYTLNVSADYVTEVKKETVAKKFSKTVYLFFSDGRYYIVDMIDDIKNQ